MKIILSDCWQSNEYADTVIAHCKITDELLLLVKEAKDILFKYPKLSSVQYNLWDKENVDCLGFSWFKDDEKEEVLKGYEAARGNDGHIIIDEELYEDNIPDFNNKIDFENFNILSIDKGSFYFICHSNNYDSCTYETSEIYFKEIGL